MSGFSSETPCPNCNSNADAYTDHKPFEHTLIECYDCGLVITPKIDYMDLGELNEFRQDMDLEPLQRLPKQEYEM